MVAADAPVIRAGSPPYRSGVDTAEGVDFVVVMRRYVGQTDTWVYVGEGEDTNHAIEVTAESARRLVTVLSRLLG